MLKSPPTVSEPFPAARIVPCEPLWMLPTSSQLPIETLPFPCTVKEPLPAKPTALLATVRLSVPPETVRVPEEPALSPIIEVSSRGGSQ